MVEWLFPDQFAARVPCSTKTIIRAVRTGRLKARQCKSVGFKQLPWSFATAIPSNTLISAGQLRKFKLLPGGPRRKR